MSRGERSGSSGRCPVVADVFRLLGVGSERVVACRDMSGHAARVVICARPDGVVLSASDGGPVRLTSRQAARLGAVLTSVNAVRR